MFKVYMMTQIVNMLILIACFTVGWICVTAAANYLVEVFAKCFNLRWLEYEY